MSEIVDDTNNKMIYKKRLIAMSRATLIDELKDRLTEKRLNHCLRVEATAIKLAKHHGVDVESASIIGLSHDLLRELSEESMAELVKKYHLDEELIQYGREIMHGPLAAEWLRRHAELDDSSIYQAIFSHTVGAEQMDPLAQVLFIADYIEPARSFSGVEKARKLAYSNLNQATAFKLQHSLNYLIQSGVQVYPKTINVYNTWVPYLLNRQEEE